jgi:hypothetical protein
MGGAAGPGGTDGQGIGGGVYIAPGGMASADGATLITGNHASTSNDDVYGDLGGGLRRWQGRTWGEAVSRIFNMAGSIMDDFGDFGEY